mgnify:CR=1 FL=1
MLRPIDPITLRLLNGEEVQFLLSMGGLRRIKKRFGCSQIADVLQRDVEECGVPLLYEALLDKGSRTEEEFADLLPANLNDVLRAVLAMLGISMPTEQQQRPTEASPETPPLQ